jgi:hypothetical protein
MILQCVSLCREVWFIKKMPIYFEFFCYFVSLYHSPVLYTVKGNGKTLVKDECVGSVTIELFM